MAQPMRDEVVYYFDVHPTEEDLMGETPPHSWLVHYLMDVLTWLFHKQICAIHENYNFYQTSDEHERPLVPDIAIIKGRMRSHGRRWSVRQPTFDPSFSGEYRFPAVFHAIAQTRNGNHLNMIE